MSFVHLKVLHTKFAALFTAAFRPSAPGVDAARRACWLAFAVAKLKLLPHHPDLVSCVQVWVPIHANPRNDRYRC